MKIKGLKTNLAVIRFIAHYKELHPNAIEDAFLHGNCYWFAKTLADRFSGRIYYAQIDNHFFTKIEDKFYDIRGEIFPEGTDVYPWDAFLIIDPLEASRVYKYCVLKDY